MNKNLARYISKLVKIDQGARNLKLNNSNLLGDLSSYIIYLIDGLHNWRIHKFIGEYGYPTQKLVGKQGMRDFWLLVQHQDFDPELQKTCFKYCDFGPKERAYLTDRILVNAGKKQLYGTQFFRNEKNRLTPRSVKDEENLDKRREAIGLESFQKYMEEMTKKSKSPNSRK